MGERLESGCRCVAGTLDGLGGALHLHADEQPEQLAGISAAPTVDGGHQEVPVLFDEDRLGAGEGRASAEELGDGDGHALVGFDELDRAVALDRIASLEETPRLRLEPSLRHDLPVGGAATHLQFMAQHRHLAGTPAGGRYASHPHAAAEITLDDGSLPATAVRYLAERPGEATAGATVEIEGTDWSGPHVVTVGVIDGDAVTAYRNGQCHALALAIAERTGWPIVAVGPGECCYDEDCLDTEDSSGLCSCQVQHLAVERPDGWLIDIEGPRPPEDFILASADPDLDEIHDLAPDRLEEIIWRAEAWRRPDVVVARGFVDAALVYEPD